VSPVARARWSNWSGRNARDAPVRDAKVVLLVSEPCAKGWARAAVGPDRRHPSGARNENAGENYRERERRDSSDRPKESGRESRVTSDVTLAKEDRGRQRCGRREADRSRDQSIWRKLFVNGEGGG